MTRNTWKQVTELLANQEFIISCAEDGVQPEDALGVSSYTRAEKCSHPIDLNRIAVQTGEISRVQVPCGSNHAELCPECSEFKKRLRVVQMLLTLDRPGVQSAFFTVTAPSYGKVHRSTWSAKDAYKWRNLSADDLYRKRLTLQKQREADRCPCGEHHSFDEPLIGSPLRSYNYLEEVLFNKNLPTLMQNTMRTLKYRAQSAGIDLQAFRIFAVYERQKRGSLHAHFLLVVDNNPFGFSALVRGIAEGWKSPTAELPESLLAGLEVGFSRVLEDEWLLFSQPKGKRTLAAVIPMDSSGRARTLWGKEHKLEILRPDVAGETVPDDEEDDSKTAFVSQPKSYAKAAGYLAKYLSKGSNNFSPDALKSSKLSVEQRNHLGKFRRAAVLLFADKILFEARLKQMYELHDYLRAAEAVPAGIPLPVNAGFSELLLEEHFAEQLAALHKEGVTRNLMSDALVRNALQRTLTVTAVREILTRYAEFYFPFGFGVDGVEGILSAPLMRVKMLLNRLANNGGFTGTLCVSANWLHTLKELKENRQEYYRLNNPDAVVEDAEFVWELDRADSSWSFDAAAYWETEREAERSNPSRFREQKRRRAQARYFSVMKSASPGDAFLLTVDELLAYMNSERAVTVVDYVPRQKRPEDVLF